MMRDVVNDFGFQAVLFFNLTLQPIGYGAGKIRVVCKDSLGIIVDLNQLDRTIDVMGRFFQPLFVVGVEKNEMGVGVLHHIFELGRLGHQIKRCNHQAGIHGSQKNFGSLVPVAQHKRNFISFLQALFIQVFSQFDGIVFKLSISQL